MTSQKTLEQRLMHIHDRIKWIANAEERATWLKGYGARGEFEPERDRLLAEAERVLDELSNTRG